MGDLPGWAVPLGIGIGSLLLGPTVAGLAGAGAAGAAGGAAAAGGLGSMFSPTALQAAGLLAAAGGSMFGGDRLDGSRRPKKPKIDERKWTREYQEAPEGYRPGIDPEHTYFRRNYYHEGGMVRPMPNQSQFGPAGRFAGMMPGRDFGQWRAQMQNSAAPTPPANMPTIPNFQQAFGGIQDMINNHTSQFQNQFNNMRTQAQTAINQIPQQAMSGFQQATSSMSGTGPMTARSVGAFGGRQAFAEGGRVSESTKHERARREREDVGSPLLNMLGGVGSVFNPGVPDGMAYDMMDSFKGRFDRGRAAEREMREAGDYAAGGLVKSYADGGMVNGGWARPSEMFVPAPARVRPPTPTYVIPPRPAMPGGATPATPAGPTNPYDPVKQPKKYAKWKPPVAGTPTTPTGGGTPAPGGIGNVPAPMPVQQPVAPVRTSSMTRDAFQDQQMMNRVTERAGGGMAQGGLVKGYAEGGIASLPKSMGKDDQKLIEMAAMALMGQVENADEIIQQFVSEFGPKALEDLSERVKVIMAQQMPQSDGLNDKIPAQLSEGEYVIPADAVSHLGNGSTDAGGKQLDSMVEKVRAMRGANKPKAIDPMEAMPV